mmetsp:Transcript_61555/g.191270  ORF Transcript_61555/g.191270 Transcript_61555/m.191270 type:complete len:89 (-) Transcript_61555:103-369(-)
MGCCGSSNGGAHGAVPVVQRVNSGTLLAGGVMKAKAFVTGTDSATAPADGSVPLSVGEDPPRSGKRRVTFGTVATREYRVQMSHSASF